MRKHPCLAEPKVHYPTHYMSGMERRMFLLSQYHPKDVPIFKGVRSPQRTLAFSYLDAVIKYSHKVFYSDPPLNGKVDLAWGCLAADCEYTRARVFTLQALMNGKYLSRWALCRLLTSL